MKNLKEFLPPEFEKLALLTSKKATIIFPNNINKISVMGDCKLELFMHSFTFTIIPFVHGAGASRASGSMECMVCGKESWAASPKNVR